jgi:hypothetical protein
MILAIIADHYLTFALVFMQLRGLPARLEIKMTLYRVERLHSKIDCQTQDEIPSQGKIDLFFNRFSPAVASGNDTVPVSIHYWRASSFCPGWLESARMVPVKVKYFQTVPNETKNS